MTVSDKARATGFKELVAVDEMHAIGALMYLYEYQTSDEQASGDTKWDNDVGFSGADSEILSSFAEQYRAKQGLSPKQISFLQKMMQKYWRQCEGRFEPLPNNWERNSRRKDEKETGAGSKAKGKHVMMKDDVLEIRFPYDPTTVAEVKTISGRRFKADNKNDKHWTAPREIETVKRLAKMGFEIQDELITWADEASVEVETREVDAGIPGLKMDLYGFQTEGVQFIEDRNGRAIVGDEMGLGKTPQSLAWLQLHPEARPAVIIVPASLKLNWEREANRWMTDPKVQIISGKPNRNPVKLSGDLIVINYDILPNDTEKIKMANGQTKKVELAGSGWVDYLTEMNPVAVILDECHYIKNAKALRTKACQKIAKGAKHVICLSGTPIVNRPIEFFNALRIVDKQLFPSFFKYAERYCGATANEYGWDFSGASNTKELHKILTDTVMVRRLKKDVLKDLPEKQRTVIPMEIENREEYDRAFEDFLNWLKGESEDGEKAVEKAEAAEALVKIEKLKQLVMRGKAKECSRWIENFLESGEKLVVFTTHRKVIDGLYKKFKDVAVKLDGGTSMTDRQAAVDSFQSDPSVLLFIGNIKAAGVGITLTEASNVCFVELPWSPGELDQAEDRTHRIGQESDSVNIWYLVADKTVEDDIAELLDTKRTVLKAVLDGAEVETGSLLMDLLKGYAGDE